MAPARRHRMWRALDSLIASNDDATGRLKIETVKTKDGPVRYLGLLERKDIAAKLVDLPMIIADARASEDMALIFMRIM